MSPKKVNFRFSLATQWDSLFSIVIVRYVLSHDFLGQCIFVSHIQAYNTRVISI